MTLMEILYIVWRKEGKEAAQNAYAETKMLPIEIVNVDEVVLLQAGSIKARFVLSVMDAFIIATAKEKGGVLIHKDPEFEQVTGEVQCTSFPYK